MVLQIHAAYFATDADYQGGRQFLIHLIGTDENNEEATLKMSVGADWDSADGGVTITHPTKKQQRINQSTIYGHFISHAQEIPDLVAELQNRPGGPTNAKVWEGLILHLQEREIKFGRNIEPQQRLMPTEYFGLIQDAVPGTVAPVPQAPVAMAPVGVPQVPITNVPAPVAPPAAPVAAVDPQALLAAARANAAAPAPTGNPMYDKYVSLARTTDWPTFLATALADPEVLADDEFAQQVINEGSLYTSARA